MSERTFAPWVEPIAARFAATRREVADIQMGPFTFGMALQGFSFHDVEHLGQIRKALSS